uniref:Uncharacterized protein n=1 Tax=Anguilla anguilla TaxID=7936 RepID=A0A0E9S882_ANGAN
MNQTEEGRACASSGALQSLRFGWRRRLVQVRWFKLKGADGVGRGCGWRL